MPGADRVVVVGGGLTGLLAAAIRSAQGHHVAIVEAGQHLGGLLSSSEGADGAWFDCGTHIPQETGLAAVDEILFDGMRDEPWHELGPLHAGNVFKGVLNEHTPFPDLNLLGTTDHAIAVSELLRVPSVAGAPASCADHVRSTFGETVTREVFAPAMRKLLGRDLDALAPRAHELFLSRVVALDPDTTRELKRAPHVDAVLAFHSGLESSSPRRAFYPAHGGSGRWISDVAARRLTNVDQHLGVTVEEVVAGGQRVERVRLSNGGWLPVDELIWTTPAIAYARAAALPVPDGVTRPVLRSTQLHHLVLDGDLHTDTHYFTVFDEDLELFRATVYRPLRREGPPSCTLEVMSDAPASDASTQLDRLVHELRLIGVLGPRTRVVSSEAAAIRDGFPVLTPEFLDSARAIADLCQSSTENLRLLGRSTGRVFFMRDVLADCHEQLT